jgi:hypothetical protein
VFAYQQCPVAQPVTISLLIELSTLLVFNRRLSNGAVSKLCQTGFYIMPFYSQSVPVHSANCVETYTVACRRVFSNALL